MSRFHETMDNFGNAIELPEGFKDAISSAYDEDFSISHAKVSDLESQLNEKDNNINQLNTDYSAQISSLKSANYDLLRAVPKDAQVVNANDNDRSNQQDHDITIADLFVKK